MLLVPEMHSIKNLSLRLFGCLILLDQLFISLLKLLDLQVLFLDDRNKLRYLLLRPCLWCLLLNPLALFEHLLVRAWERHLEIVYLLKIVLLYSFPLFLGLLVGLQNLFQN